jgi:type I restriction enzyme R subunit
VVSKGNAQTNARVLVATYQTLDVDTDDADANFLLAHYPPNYFSHIVIDECHRSAWGKWSQVLDRNPDAVQIGLTATPRQLQLTRATREAEHDARIAADNFRHFGEPVYEYDMGQGTEDGYLAACELVRRDIFLDRKTEPERASGLDQQDLWGKLLRDATTGETLTVPEARPQYDAPAFEAALLLPDRVEEMCRDLFEHLRDTGGPEQKTIIFCARDDHADRVAVAMNNLYAEWCARSGKRRAEPYAFKCTAASGGADYLADLRGAPRSYFVATTVDLLTTGVDVPVVRNIVFFKYVKSPIAFYQMVGRGTRLDPPSGKLMFRVYDYTNATRLFGEQFLSRLQPPKKEREDGGDDLLPPPGERERTIEVLGFDVRITDAGRLIVTQVDGKAMPVTLEDYKEQVAARVVAEAPTLDAFRRRWIAPGERRTLLAALPDAGRSAGLVRTLEGLDDCDLYDVLADLAYGLAPKSRAERADAFTYKHAAWLEKLPGSTAATLRALAGQFAQAGTDGLENPHIFQTPEVVRAGGLAALQALGQPAAVLRETKERMFAA